MELISEEKQSNEWKFKSIEEKIKIIKPYLIYVKCETDKLDEYCLILANGKSVSIGPNLISYNGFLIIDETQQLSYENGSFEKLFNTLHQYKQKNPNKIFLSTATSIYDNPHGESLTLNVLRPRIQFPPKKSSDEMEDVD
jgi:hypothetical protein